MAGDGVMTGRHRRENGGITVRALRDRCEYHHGHLVCTIKAGHCGWHLFAYPGTQSPVYYATAVQIGEMP